MRAIWSGTLSFGLVNIPVKLYSASEEGELKFRYLHSKDLSPIRYARVCKDEGLEVAYEDIVRGFEFQKGDFIVLTDEEIKKANPQKTKTVSIMQFVKETEIDPIYFEKPYFLEPDNSENAYALLREALKKSKKVAVAKFVLRDKEHLAIIKPYKDIVVLNSVRYAREIRSSDELKAPDKAKLQQKELDMAIKLIDELTETFDATKHEDTYKNELKALIEEKKKKGKVHERKGEELRPTTRVPDIMEALKASLALSLPKGLARKKKAEKTTEKEKVHAAR